MDEVLHQCNETELLSIARKAGIGLLKRGLDRETLIAIVAGEVNPEPGHFAATKYTREKLQLFIVRNWGILASQLPGCNGQCTTFPCSDAQHSACLIPNRDLVVSG